MAFRIRADDVRAAAPFGLSYLPCSSFHPICRSIPISNRESTGASRSRPIQRRTLRSCEGRRPGRIKPLSSRTGISIPRIRSLSSALIEAGVRNRGTGRGHARDLIAAQRYGLPQVHRRAVGLGRDV